MALIDRIRLHNKVDDLKERTQEIGRCHNEFCVLQKKYNRSIKDQIESIQEEVGYVYEHIEKLAEIQDTKCKYAEDCQEHDCYYEEYADKIEKELNNKVKKEDGR